MKTRLRPNNPFGRNRYAFLWEVLHAHPGGKHLDYGAFDGSILLKLHQTGVIREGVGVDVNQEMVQEHASKMPPILSLVHVQAARALPFSSNSFDSVSVLDVIEHVVDQRLILRECVRVLKPGGQLIVTVPGKHLFSFLDIGNFKFRFPRLHRWYYTRKYSAEQYHERYVLCKNGLIGDIEKAKSWHQHFSRKELGALLRSCGAEDVRFDGCGFFNRPLELLAFLSPRPLKRLIDRLIRWDEKIFSKTHLYSCSHKPGATPHLNLKSA